VKFFRKRSANERETVVAYRSLYSRLDELRQSERYLDKVARKRTGILSPARLFYRSPKDIDPLFDQAMQRIWNLGTLDSTGQWVATPELSPWPASTEKPALATPLFRRLLSSLVPASLDRISYLFLGQLARSLDQHSPIVRLALISSRFQRGARAAL
jgi:hypothetical protein